MCSHLSKVSLAISTLAFFPSMFSNSTAKISPVPGRLTHRFSMLNSSPAFISSDKENNCALLEWIEGNKIGKWNKDDITSNIGPIYIDDLNGYN